MTAVSPTYASELRYAYYAHGMEGIINMCWGKMHGVLNGIDMKRYDPARDAALAARYTAEELAGKTTIEVGERVHAVMEAGIVSREKEQGLRA